MGPVVFGRIGGERAERNVADHLAIEFQHHVAGVGDLADHREIQFPFVEDRLGLGLAAGFEHHEHALLALAEHHLIGRHPLLAAGHHVHVEADTRLAIGRHLDAGGGEPGGSHILDRHDRIGCHQFEAGLDQQLLGKGVADLHRGPLGIRILAEIGARHGRAVDSVAPGLGADIDDRIAHPGGGGIEDPVGIGDANGHRVDEDVAVVCGVEIGLARDCRHPDAIAVAADPGDNALDQMLHLGMLGTPEAQCIGVGDGPRAHGEDIAQDAANPGRRALIGFDVAGVVVALHLEDGSLPIADIDHARVLAGAADHPGRFGRQFLQVQARALVGAMLRPHHRKDAELDHIGLAPQRIEHALVFLGAETVLLDGLGGDWGGDRGSRVCHARALSAARSPPPAPRGACATASAPPRRPAR